MLSPLELSQYLLELPKDLSLKINEKQYMVNRDLAASLSNYISKKINEDPGLNFILIELPDPTKVFPVIVSFLNGKKIDITPDNDYYLNKFAAFLEIQTLKNLTEKSLQDPLLVSNIVQRILHFDDIIPDEYVSYFEQNVESIIKFHSSISKNISDNKIFNINPIFLSKIIHSEKSRFSNDSNRYLFALDCCYISFLKYENPETISNFINSDDIPKIPDDVIRQMITSERYEALDGQFPSILLAQRLITEIMSLQEQINETNNEFLLHENELENIRKEDERIMQEKSNSDIKLNEVGQRRYKFAQSLLKSASLIDKKISGLSQFIVYDSIIDEISSNLTSLEQKSGNLKRILIKISGTKVILADLRSKGLDLTKQFESLLKTLQATIDMLIPNENDVNGLVEEFRKISKNLHFMADTLVKLDGNEQ